MVPPGVAGGTLEFQGWQLQLTWSLREDDILPFDHPVSLAIQQFPVLFLLAQLFDDGVRVFRVGELTLDNLVGVVEFYRQVQLLLNVDLVIAGGELNKSLLRLLRLRGLGGHHQRQTDQQRQQDPATGGRQAANSR